MAKVRPLSLREILKFVRQRGVPSRRGYQVRDLYFITEMELRALASAFYRATHKNRRSSTTAKGKT